jgi:hypothetical protein
VRETLQNIQVDLGLVFSVKLELFVEFAFRFETLASWSSVLVRIEVCFHAAKSYLGGQKAKLLSDILDWLGLLGQSNGNIAGDGLQELQGERNNGALARLVEETNGRQVGVLHQHGNGHRANSTGNGGDMGSVICSNVVLDITDPANSRLLGGI